MWMCVWRGVLQRGVQQCALVKILQGVWRSLLPPESRFARQRDNGSNSPFPLKFACLAAGFDLLPVI